MGRNQQWLSPYASIYQHHKNGFIILDVGIFEIDYFAYFSLNFKFF